jgi:hypothetical protein
MFRRRIVPLIVVPLLAGCAQMHAARYVYQDGQFGVVGIPSDTCYWPTFYRKQAEVLMAQHFPEGYEIIRAEEVVEGSRTLVRDNGAAAQVSPELPAALLKVASLGVTSDRKESDSVKIMECRIIYKKADHRDGAKPSGFAAAPTLTPTYYVDPNAAEHRGGGSKPSDPALSVCCAKAVEAPKDKVASNAGEPCRDAKEKARLDPQVQ